MKFKSIWILSILLLTFSQCALRKHNTNRLISKHGIIDKETVLLSYSVNENDTSLVISIKSDDPKVLCRVTLLGLKFVVTNRGKKYSLKYPLGLMESQSFSLRNDLQNYWGNMANNSYELKARWAIYKTMGYKEKFGRGEYFKVSNDKNILSNNSDFQKTDIVINIHKEDLEQINLKKSKLFIEFGRFGINSSIRFRYTHFPRMRTPVFSSNNIFQDEWRFRIH